MSSQFRLSLAALIGQTPIGDQHDAINHYPPVVYIVYAGWPQWTNVSHLVNAVLQEFARRTMLLTLRIGMLPAGISCLAPLLGATRATRSTHAMGLVRDNLNMCASGVLGTHY